jgi:hypothetical protein
VAADIAPGTVTTTQLAGSITNAKLANSNVTVNGTSINLGASGSIQPVSWQSVVVSDGSTVTTMVAGNGYFVNNTSAAGLVKLPISASAGDTVAIKDYAGNFGTNSLTIQRNGHNIQGVANDSLISTNRASLTLVYVDATKGWLYAVESNVATFNPSFISATGGTIATSGDFKIHSFTGDGCFVVSSLGGGATPCAVASTVDYLVVAGGGGAGTGSNVNTQSAGGGGGAGGFREAKDSTIASPHAVSPLAATTGLTITDQTYPITVGAGGAGGIQCGPFTTGFGGTVGNPSIFSTITSSGGGKGGRGNNGAGNGGSGGGAGAINSSAGSGNTPPVSPSQGTNGSNGASDAGGGGGGATVAACNATPENGADGGAGATTSISGSPTAYAGGGGGAGETTKGCGGAGGGGAGFTNGSNGPGSGVAGTANTGGGGGGAHSNSNCNPTSGGTGGSGIVVIRYKFQ